jgi:hypothetical protein
MRGQRPSRDARFFWEADRRSARVAARAGPLLFHKKLGATARGGSHRTARASDRAVHFNAGEEIAPGRQAARLSVDLTTDMVREFTELQGSWVSTPAKKDDEAVWKAIYFHHLPIGVEVTPAVALQLRKRHDAGGGPAADCWIRSSARSPPASPTAADPICAAPPQGGVKIPPIWRLGKRRP